MRGYEDIFRASAEVGATKAVHDNKRGETRSVQYLAAQASLPASDSRLRFISQDRHPWWRCASSTSNCQAYAVV